MTTVTEAIEVRSEELSQVNATLMTIYRSIEVEGGFDDASKDLIQKYEDCVDRVEILSTEVENLETRGRLR